MLPEYTSQNSAIFDVVRMENLGEETAKLVWRLSFSLVFCYSREICVKKILRGGVINATPFFVAKQILQHVRSCSHMRFTCFTLNVKYSITYYCAVFIIYLYFHVFDTYRQLAKLFFILNVIY